MSSVKNKGKKILHSTFFNNKNPLLILMKADPYLPKGERLKTPEQNSTKYTNPQLAKHL